MREAEYQQDLKKKILRRLPGALVLKNDPSWIQGIPDLTILYGSKWASLEVKRSEGEPHRPNQDHYIDRMNDWSYSSFIFPENEEAVLDELQRALEP